MELSSILYIIEDAYFEEWFGEIAKTDEGGHLETMLKSERILNEQLTEENKELLKKYIYSSSSYYEMKLFNMCEKVLEEGIKIGMDIQKILSET